MVDVEEVPMSPRRRPPARRTALAIATLVLAASCSSSPASDGPPSTAADPVHAQNKAYLLGLGWEKDQAACVSETVTIDLEELLAGTNGAAPTDKPGFAEFAGAVRSCLRKDAGLTSTTVPAG